MAGRGFDAMQTPADGVMAAVWAVIAIAGIAGTHAVQLWNRVSEARRVQQLKHFNDHFSGPVQAVAELLSSARDDRAGEQFFTSLLRSGCALFPHVDGVRLCVYTLEEGDGNGDREAPAGEFLRLQESAGRGDKPRPEFTPDQEHGAALIAAVRAGKAIPVPDPARPPFPVDWSEHAVWRSFMLVLLRNREAALGCLLIDARAGVRWGHEDLAVAMTIAELLVIGMGQMRVGGIDARPEARQVAAELPRLRRERAVLEEGRDTMKLNSAEGGGSDGDGA